MYKKVIIVALCLIGEMESRSTIAAKQTKITKVYNHESDLQDRLVLYFSSAPDCLYIPKRGVAYNNNQPLVTEGGMKQLSYFFPVHGMSAQEIHKFVAKVDGMKHSDYTVTMHHDKHKDGIAINIAFNDKKVGFQYESFSAITGEPALSFAFFKRSSLDHINLGKSLFNTAYSSKKKIR